MRIEKPGLYRTREGKKAEVVAVRHGFASGFCDHVPTAWVCGSGQHWNRCTGTDGSDQRLAIVAEWRDPETETVELELCRNLSGGTFTRFRHHHASNVTLLARRTITITEGEGMEPANS